MKRILLLVMMAFFVVPFADKAQGVDTISGDACSVNGQVVRTSNSLLACTGLTWLTIQEYNQGGGSLVQIGFDSQPCTTEKEGRLRYSSTLPAKWEYCDGSGWEAFTYPACQEDAQAECHLTATRNTSDIDFTPANIKSGANILGVTGTLDGDYGSPGATSYGALEGRGLATGPGTACAILLDNTVSCWGRGTDGELGDGNSTSSLARVAVDSSAVSGTVWTKIDAGYNHVCGIRDNGSMWCWGYGGDGQLGNGLTGNSDIPSLVSTAGVSGTTWINLLTGAFHTCGFRDDNTAWCWGFGGRGQLGHGASPTQQTTPVPVSSGSITGTAWTVVDGGWRASCGVRNNGTIWCWGWGYSGMIGDENGADHNSNIPVITIGTGVSGTAWTDVSTSDDAHTCGIRDNGTAWCWGYGTWGRIGQGSTASAITPAQVITTGVSGTAWVKLSAGSRHTCGIRDDGTIWCWGYGSNGQLGNQSPRDVQATPVKANDAGVTGTAWTVVDSGSFYVCGIRDDDTIWCWGDPGNGVLGRPTYGTHTIIPQ